MRKRIFATLLAMALIASVLSVPAMAASDSTSNFVRSKTYAAGTFSDVKTSSVFYNNITALYEYGLSVGKEDGTFGPQDSVTVGQIIIFASRIRSLYRTGSAEAGAAAYRSSGSSTVLPHLRYLQAEGVLGTELDGSLTAAATRAQVAHVLANTLPESALPAVHDALVTQAYASRQYIKDVTEYTPYYQDILDLYRCGVSVGSDATGSYGPSDPVTRGAVAAMLTRMVDPDLRLTPSWAVRPSYSAAGTTMVDLVTPGTYVSDPSSATEMDASIRYMLSSGKNTLTLQYDGLTPSKASSVMQLALQTVKLYCEQCYNTVSCTYTLAGSITLTFSASGLTKSISACREETMAAAIEVHDELWETGQITADMAEYEKARVYYTWICNNCVYDESAGDDSTSHIAYSLFKNGTAVCDGYTGAYNLLLKLEGIDCTTQSNETHIWTVATLDGTQYHIDTTWGDSGSSPSYRFFAMDPMTSWRLHPW